MHKWERGSDLRQVQMESLGGVLHAKPLRLYAMVVFSTCLSWNFGSGFCWWYGGPGSTLFVQLLLKQKWRMQLLARCFSGYVKFVPPNYSKPQSFLVQTRDAATLLPIIQSHVAPGTVIHSDQWRAYSQIALLPSVSAHRTVNHSINFVDPTNGVHTQHIESYWNRVKVKLKHMKGCHLTQLPGYLDEFLWRERHGNTGKEVFSNVMLHISQQYPV